MKLFLSTLALCFLLGAAPRARASSPLRVFILAGQSNMEGKGDGGKLTAEERQQLNDLQGRVLFAYNGKPVRPLGVTPAGGNKKRFGVDTTFGPELFFGLRLAQAWPGERILLIKHSLGNTSLYGAWNPDWNLEQATAMQEAKVPHLYAGMIADVRAVLANYAPDSYQLCGMLWVQGENDSAIKKYGTAAGEAYGRNISNLIRRVRQDTGVPDLPFLMVEVGSGKVTEGMDNAAKTMKNVTVVPKSHDPAAPNFFPTYPVGHYNYEGQKRIGSLLAAAYLRDYGAAVRDAAGTPAESH